MSIFNRGRQPQSSGREHAAQLVEQVLRAASVDPAASRIPVADGMGWKFVYGSAQVEVYITSKQETDYLQVLCPIMYLPHHGLLAFYRRLLELNMIVPNIRFGVYGDLVYLYSERTLAGLDLQETYEIISTLTRNADEYDNRLVDEFGGRLFLHV
ncbi:YbjN domain-containing protein [Aggregatilineales bacterium SYSU G02658]